jgi:ADP-heptose:LPS heptosyltransferase
VRDMHTIDYNLALLEPLGVRAASSAPQLDLPRTAREKADRLRRDWKITRPYVILHPGSARPEKLWDTARWAEVVDHFHQDNEFDFVLTSGPAVDEQTHIAAITHARGKIHRPLWKDRSAYAGGVSWAGAAARDSRFGASALRGCLTYAAGDPVRADESVSLAANG